METQHPESNKPLKEALFERIESEHVCPRSRWFFHCQECGVWGVWLVSIIVGALAVAVSLFVITHQQYELYEATHENFLTFFVDVLPYIWFVTFGIVVYVAVVDLRYTKHGYRYPLWAILTSSVLFSVMIGIALQLFGFGYTVDNMLGKHLDMYLSQSEYEQKLWQKPEKGRLVGRQVLGTVEPMNVIVFEDVDGTRWRMNVAELHPGDVELLATEKTVRLMGQAQDEQLRIFHACGAFPWMVSKNTTVAHMIAERKVFLERVYEHVRRAHESRASLQTQSFASTSLPQHSVCATISAVRRMPVEPAPQ